MTSWYYENQCHKDENMEIEESSEKYYFGQSKSDSMFDLLKAEDEDLNLFCEEEPSSLDILKSSRQNSPCDQLISQTQNDQSSFSPLRKTLENFTDVKVSQNPCSAFKI